MLIVRDIPLEKIRPDPDQPRKIFEQAALKELAASIAKNGLIQPITVRVDAAKRGHFVIIAGERRYRACEVIGAKTVPAIVREEKSEAETRVWQIIENDVRKDVTPLEQARSYRDVMGASNWTVEELAARIGKDPWRIRERTTLLDLEPEYQKLFAGGSLTASEAQCLAQLKEPRLRRKLFAKIKTGACRTYADLRVATEALVNAEKQGSLIEQPEPATDAERTRARGFKARMDSVAALLRSAIKDNEVRAVGKVDPNELDRAADLCALMQKDLRRIETALRAESACRASGELVMRSGSEDDAEASARAAHPGTRHR